MAPANELFSTLLRFMFSAALVLTAFAAPSSLSDDASTSPTITTSSGAYRGGLNRSQGVEFFKGIRYGQPPIGNLRFAAPVAVSTPSDGGGEQVQDATNFGNACPQLNLGDAFTILYGSPSLAADIAEDCLFLNIYRPKGTNPGANLPILVFIHGGAYSVGAGSQFDGTNMVHRSVSNGSPIIFITINYRLYVTGFLGTASLPAKDLNAGLLDQRLALTFLRDNAAAFGGDAAKVTAWGQSAGGSSVGMHYLFPPSGGTSLFRGAIEDSGTAQVLTVPHVEEYDLPDGPFTNLATVTGCNGSGNVPLACLRNLSIDALLTAASQVDPLTPQAAPGQSTTWYPVVGPAGSFITEEPSARYQNGEFLKVPLISGTNLDEGTLFVINFLNLNQTPAEDEATFASFIRNRTIVPRLSDSTVSTFLELYPELPPSPTSNSSLFDRMALFANDFHFLAPQRVVQDVVGGEEDVKMYAYLFNADIPGLPAELGAFHGAELTYFQILNRTVQADPAAQAFSAQLMDFYLNFTVNLDPGTSWTEFSSSNPKILQLEIGNITMVEDTIRLNQTDFINSEPVVDESER